MGVVGANSSIVLNDQAGAGVEARPGHYLKLAGVRLVFNWWRIRPDRAGREGRRAHLAGAKIPFIFPLDWFLDRRWAL